MKRYYFNIVKIKKLRHQKNALGVLVPSLHDDMILWDDDSYIVVNNFYDIYGHYYKNIGDINPKDIERVVVEDTNVKNILDSFIKKAKQKFMLEEQVYMEKKKIRSLKSEIRSLEKELKVDAQKILSSKGYISEKDFEKLIDERIYDTEGYSTGVSISSGTIKEIILTKEYDLGDDLDNDSYDFIDLEYGRYDYDADYKEEDTLSVDIDYMLNKSTDFKEIKAKEFKEFPMNEIDSNRVEVSFMDGINNDKKSASIYHIITIDLKNPLPLRNSSIDVIDELKNKLFSSLS